MIERILKGSLLWLPLFQFTDITSLNVLEVNLIIFDFAYSNTLYYGHN